MGERRIFTAAIAAALALGVAASAAAASAPKLKVRLIEYEVQPKLDFIAAGKTKIVVKNGGTEEHEFVIVRADDAATLPVKADGSVDEDKIPKADAVGELEEIAKGKSKSKVFKLKPGKYVFFCNIVDNEDDGTVVSHFAKGMHTVVDAS